MNKLEKEIFEMEEELGVPSHLRWHNSKPKQETLEESKNICIQTGLPCGMQCLSEEVCNRHKQETLEELALKIIPDKSTKGWIDSFSATERVGFIKGFQLAKQNSYDEKEVIELLQKALTHKDDGETGSLVTAQGEIRPANFFSWFERFKKK